MSKKRKPKKHPSQPLSSPSVSEASTSASLSSGSSVASASEPSDGSSALPLDSLRRSTGIRPLPSTKPNDPILVMHLSEMVYLRTVLILAAIGLGLYLLYTLRAVVTPVLLALAFAYLINPLVDRMESWGLSRSIAIFILLLLTSVLLVFGILLLLPALSRSIEQLASLLERLPSLIDKLRIWLQVHFKMQVPKTWTEAFYQWGDQIREYAPKAIRPLSMIVATLFSSGVNLLFALFNALLIPLFTFYFLKDYKFIESRVGELVPLRVRPWALARWSEIDEVISGFIRGQITVCLIIGASYLLLLSILQVPLAPGIAVFGAVINIFPYLGFLTTYLVSIIAALLSENPTMPMLLGVIFGMFAIHMLDVFYITPKVVGENVGVSELVVIIAALAGGHLFGILGVLIAIPAAAAMKVLLYDLLQRYRKSDFFNREPSA